MSVDAHTAVSRYKHVVSLCATDNCIAALSNCIDYMICFCQCHVHEELGLMYPLHGHSSVASINHTDCSSWLPTIHGLNRCGRAWVRVRVKGHVICQWPWSRRTRMSVYEAQGYPFSFNAVATSFSSCARSTPEDDKTSALVISVLTTATLCATG